MKIQNSSGWTLEMRAVKIFFVFTAYPPGSFAAANMKFSLYRNVITQERTPAKNVLPFIPGIRNYIFFSN